MKDFSEITRENIKSYLKTRRDNKYYFKFFYKLPRRFGGSEDLSNLMTLCRSCHSFEHQRLREVMSRWVD